MNSVDFEQIIRSAAVFTLPVLFAITLHEVAHGWMANKLGDGTAQMLGRLSLNPIRHIDPIGTVLVPFLLILSSHGILFGWAKPSPINQENFNNGRKDMIYVALAGPLANLLMAVGWVMVMKVDHSLISNKGVLEGFHDMAMVGITFNLMLMVLHLLPWLPLDGGRIISTVIPPRYLTFFDKIEPYGYFIVAGLLYVGVLQPVIMPFYVFFVDLFNQIFF